MLRTTNMLNNTFWYPDTRIVALASCRYRAGSLLENRSAIRGQFVRGADMSKAFFSRNSSVSVLRPRYNGRFGRELARVKSKVDLVFADFDDYLFADDVDCFPLYRSGRMSRKETVKRRDAYRRALDCFTCYTVSTEALKKRLKSVNSSFHVEVVSNGLMKGWVVQGQVYPPWKPGDKKIIRYLSGSPSHDEDISGIREVLAQFLGEHPTITLEIIGHIKEAWGGLPRDQVRYRNSMPYNRLPLVLASAWVTIAPLTDSEYSRCKSGVKYLESAAFGCPTIATSNGELQRYANHGLLLAENKEQWYAHFNALLDDAYRMTLGAEGCEYVLKNAMSSTSCRQLIEAINTFNGGEK